jgi:hypothetical protein
MYKNILGYMYHILVNIHNIKSMRREGKCHAEQESAATLMNMDTQGKRSVIKNSSLLQSSLLRKLL